MTRPWLVRGTALALLFIAIGLVLLGIYLSLIQYLDMKTYLAGDILTKVDRASMAHGLEARAPFIDREVTRLAFSLPLSLRRDKALLRRLMRARGLPESIVGRPKKGFGVPVAGWARGRDAGGRQWVRELGDAAGSRGHGGAGLRAEGQHGRGR